MRPRPCMVVYRPNSLNPVNNYNIIIPEQRRYRRVIGFNNEWSHAYTLTGFSSLCPPFFF